MWTDYLAENQSSSNRSTIPWQPLESHAICYHLWNNDINILGRSIKDVDLPILPVLHTCFTWLFLVFLVIFLRRAVTTLKSRPSPSRKFFYAFVWLVAAVNLIRAILELVSENFGSHGLHPRVRERGWPDAEDIAFLVVTSFNSCLVWTIEASVLIFLLHGHVYVWKALLRRVALITGILASLFTIIQVVVIVIAIQHRTESDSHNEFVFHKEMAMYWVIVHGFNSLVYILLLALFLLPCCKGKCCRAPTRQAIYIYLFYMFLLHGMYVIGYLLSSKLKIDGGFCISAVVMFLNFATYGPILYHLFLWDYFHKNNPNPHAYLNEIVNSVPASYAYLPSFPRRSSYETPTVVSRSE